MCKAWGGGVGASPGERATSRATGCVGPTEAHQARLRNARGQRTVGGRRPVKGLQWPGDSSHPALKLKHQRRGGHRAVRPGHGESGSAYPLTCPGTKHWQLNGPLNWCLWGTGGKQINQSEPSGGRMGLGPAVPAGLQGGFQLPCLAPPSSPQGMAWYIQAR